MKPRISHMLKLGIYPIIYVTETHKLTNVKWKAFSRAINDTTCRSWAQVPKEHSCGAISSSQQKDWCPQLNKQELHSVGAFRPNRAATLLNGEAITPLIVVTAPPALHPQCPIGWIIAYVMHVEGVIPFNNDVHMQNMAEVMGSV